MEVSRNARIATRLFLLPILFVVGLLFVAAGGLFFYKSDLRDITALSVFAPEATTTIPDIYICGKKATVVAVPTGRITNLRNALLAAEGDVDQRSILVRLYDYFLHGPEHYGHYSMQLSQGFFVMTIAEY